MGNLGRFVRRGRLAEHLRKNVAGATAIEYGLIAALIAVAVIAAWSLVGTNLSGVFNTVGTNL